MLNAVHKQLLASRLKDVFVSSPLMMVYQTLGSVPSSKITQTLQSALDQKVPNSGIKASCFKIKNTVAGGAKESGISQYLQANNIIVGWQIPESRVMHQLNASRSTALSDILSNLSPQQPAGKSQATFQNGQLPQSTVSTLIDLSIGMPSKMPVVLLASFYRGEQVNNQCCFVETLFCAANCCKVHAMCQSWPTWLCACIVQVKLKHLKEWMALDGPKVQTELLAQLDSIGVNLLEIEDVAQQLAGTIDEACIPHELLMALDMKAAEKADESKAGDAPAASS